ncbi:MAG: hypothetical protein LBV17_08930, partial [Treponema sp.]|nr:hypothetical protein [Treponema sp.]
SLISFTPKLDIQSQASEVQVLGWDILRAEGFRGGVKAGDVEQKIGGRKDWTKASRGDDGKWVDYHYMDGIAGSAEAKDMAHALMREKSFKLLRAEGSGEDNQKLSAGMPVTVKNVGTAFSGEYIAEQVHHRFSLEEGYTTDFILKRNMLNMKITMTI